MLGLLDVFGLVFDPGVPVELLGHAWAELIIPFPLARSTVKNANAKAIIRNLFIEHTINDIIFKSYENRE
ncbi:MAG TPA: hypothetical protein VH500_23545 [Nitrososphaeraceae archaeon]